jgi:hypothetical protein
MLDIDPRLDQRLRSLYAQIEEASPPSQLDHFDPESSRPRARRFNVVLATAALALVTVAVVGFAVELRAHHVGPGPSGPAVHATATPAPTPSPTLGTDAPPVVPGNPVANAAFEVPQVGGISPVTSLKGWTVVGAVELVASGTIGQPFFGRQYLVLQSSPVAGGVSQRVKTVPGTNYQLIFTTGANPACTGSGMLDVYWNGRYVMGMQTTRATHPSPGDLGWSTDAFASALATGTTTTIGFVGGGQCGASLNDVILQPLPLPGG